MTRAGLHMMDIETMIKALRLAWIPRLVREGHPNWKFVPDYFFKKYGGLYFLLSCNYDAEDFENASSFYRDILLFFHELKALYGCHHGQDTILFHNKEIRIDGKPFFWKERFEKGITTIKDLLDKNGNVLSFPVFQLKYSLQKTTFLHFYQVICANPGRLLTKAKTNDFSAEMINNEDPESFHLDKNVVINLLRAKSKSTG